MKNYFAGLGLIISLLDVGYTQILLNPFLQEVHSGFEEVPGEVHLRAVDGPQGHPAEVWLCHRQGLPKAHSGPRLCQETEHITHGGSIRSEEGCKWHYR